MGSPLSEHRSILESGIYLRERGGGDHSSVLLLMAAGLNKENVYEEFKEKFRKYVCVVVTLRLSAHFGFI